MSAGEGDWSSPHWSQGARGGRQGRGRSGLGNTTYNKSQEHFGDHQHDDRRHQGTYQGERGFSHQGQQQGRSYGNFGQQNENFPSHHQDQRRQGYLHYGQRENQLHAGFRGPPNFNSAEDRSAGYMHYYQEPIMAGPPRVSEHWQGGPSPPSYQQPPVAPEGIHARFTRPMTLVDQPQYRAPQSFPQHQVAGGHGVALGTASAMAIGGSATMHGQVYHPGTVRPSQHAGAWSSGAPVPDYRNPEAVRMANGGSGRGGSGRGGAHGRGSSSGSNVGGTNARRGSRAPPVPQPVVPNASSQTEPVNSGILSLGRPRQQPSSTVNNVQSARAANMDAAQAHGSINDARNEAAPATAASQRQADNAAGVEPETVAEVAAPAVNVGEELSLQDRSDKPAPVPSEPEVHPPRALSATSREAGSVTAATTPLAGSATMSSSAGSDTENSSCHNNASAISVTQSGTAAACASVEGRAAGSTSISGSQENRVILNGSAAVPAPQSLSAAAPPSAPLEVAVAASSTAQTALSAGGSAWRQRPATALFALGGPSAGSQAPAYKAGAQAAHPSLILEGQNSGATTGAAAAAGAQPATVAASAQAASLVAHQNTASPAPPSSTIVAYSRVNRPAPVQTVSAQGPRCPPPGFSTSPGPAISPAGAGTAPEEHAVTSQKPGHAQKSQPPRQQLSPRVSGGSDAVESVASVLLAAQLPQHSPKSASASSGHVAPSSVDFSEVSKANRKWASVAATPASSGAAHTKVPPRRPTSEGGSSDASATVAAATLVGLRHATQRSHGAPMGAHAATISGGEIDSEAAGPNKVAHASGMMIGAVSTALQNIPVGEATISKESIAPEAVGTGAAARELQQGRAAQNPQGGPQLGTVSPTTSSGPQGLKAESAVGAASITLTALPRDTAAIATAAASAASASPTRGAPSVLTPAGNGAAAESVSNPGAEVATKTWAGLLLTSNSNNARASKGAGARPRQTTKGSGASGHATAATAGPVSGSKVSAAVTVKAVAAPTQVNMEAEPPLVMITVATGSVTPDTFSTSAVTLGTGVGANSGEKTLASGNNPPTPVPAAVMSEADPTSAEEGPSNASPIESVGRTAEALIAVNSAAEAAAQGPAPAPPKGKTWASLAASTATAQQPQRNRHMTTSAALSDIKRSQGRGAAGRGSRHTPPSHRTVSAQPPEGMFHTQIATPAAQAVHGAPDRKVSEDGHGAPRLSPSLSQRVTGTATSPVKRMSPTASIELNLALPSITAAARPAAPAPAPAEPSAGSAAPSGAQEEAFASSADPKPTCGTGGTTVVPGQQDSLQASSSRSVAVSTAPVASAAAVETTAETKPVGSEGVTAAMVRQPSTQGTAPSCVEDSKPGTALSASGPGAPEADADGNAWQLAGSRHKGSKGGRGADFAHTYPVPSTESGAGRGRDRVRSSAGHPPHQGPQLLTAAGRSRASAPPTGAMAAATPAASLSTSAPTIVRQGHVGSAGHAALQEARADAGGLTVAATTAEPPAPAVPSVTVLALDVVKDAAETVATATQNERTACSHAKAAPVDVTPVPAAPLGPMAVEEAAPTEVEVATKPDEVASEALVDGYPSSAEPASDATVALEQEVFASQNALQPLAQAQGKNDIKDGSESAQPAAREDQGKAEEDKEEGEDDNDETTAIRAGNNPWELLEAAGEDGGVETAGDAASVSGTGAAVLVASAVGSSDAGITEALRQLLTLATAEQLLAVSRQQQQTGGFRIQPRGLTNTGNTCFINATMQALLACTPFAFTLSRLPAIATLLEPSKSPTLHGLALFLAELASPHAGAYSSGGSGATVSGREDTQHAAENDGWAEVPSSRTRKGGQRKGAAKQTQQPASSAAPPPASGGASSAGKGEAAGSTAIVLGGQPLVPSMLNGIAAAFNPRISIAEKQTMAKVLSKGVVEQEQQDAQEFFQFLVNQVHEEVVALRKVHGVTATLAASAGAGGDDGEEWAQVGKKNKATVTRQVGTGADDAASRSPVTAIFSGLVKSTVRFQHPNYKPSATIETFNMLHLDIAAEGVSTLEDALRQHSVPENIEYKPDGATEMLPAKKDVRLYRLPEVLVLHLKRFTYTVAGGGRYTKVQKPVTFNCTLRLEGKILAEDCPDWANSEYHLFATINHHGRTIAGGHYMTDVLQPDGHWLRFNDALVFVVPESAVLAERPYLLFYQRIPQRGA